MFPHRCNDYDIRVMPVEDLTIPHRYLVREFNDIKCRSGGSNHFAGYYFWLAMANRCWLNCFSCFYDLCSVTFTAGSVFHPMLKQHYIEWIVLETATGYKRRSCSLVMNRSLILL